MAAYTVGTAVDTGLAISPGAVSASDTFVNDGRTVLYVYNGNGSTLTVGIATPATIDGKAIGNGGGTMNTLTYKVFGPFRPDLYNAADGTVTVTYDQTTSVTAQVFKVPVF